MTLDGKLLSAGNNGHGPRGGGGAGGSVWIQTAEFYGAGTIDVKGGSIGGNADQCKFSRKYCYVLSFSVTISFSSSCVSVPCKCWSFLSISISAFKWIGILMLDLFCHFFQGRQLL